jgi:hypothetical protein
MPQEIHMRRGCSLTRPNPDLVKTRMAKVDGYLPATGSAATDFRPLDSEGKLHIPLLVSF